MPSSVFFLSISRNQSTSYLHANQAPLADTADSADHAIAATAIAKGIEAGHSAEKPGYWIHLSGTGILTWYDAVNKRSGEGPLPEQKYYDVQGIERLVTLPDAAHHRNVDKIVQEANSAASKIAIVCPPCIYGVGSGPVSTRSSQVPDMTKNTLLNGTAPIVGAGKTEWDNVNIDDLGDLYVKLVDATQDAAKKDNAEIFGLHGYFFAANGVHTWADIARQIAAEAKKQGYLAEAAAGSITQEEVNKLDGVATASFGYNSKGVPERAHKYLGWTAKGTPLPDTIAELVASEAKSLGLAAK